MKAAIFGGSGFLGQSLVRQCAAAGWDVVIYDLPGTDPKVPGVTFKEIDLHTAMPVIKDVIPVIYYLAQSANYRTFQKGLNDLFEVNTLGAIRAAQAAAAIGCRFFCYASSGSVYRWSFHPLHEGSPVRRDDPYVLSKLAAEEILGLFPEPLKTLSVRIFGLFGPHQKNMLPAVIKDKIRQREPIILHPAADENDDTEGLYVSFCYVDDAAKILMRLAELGMNVNTNPGIVNLAGPTSVSIKRLAEMMGHHLRIEPIFEKSPTPRHFDLIANIRHLQELIQPEFSPIERAVEQTILAK